LIRGFADLALFSGTCVATAAAFWARSSAPARRRGWFCIRGRLVNDAIAARFAGPAPNRGYFEQDIMAIGHDGKRFTAALPKSKRPGQVRAVDVTKKALRRLRGRRRVRSARAAPPAG